MLAHELRNPLAAVRNSVLTARLDGARRDRALEIAQRQAERLSGIVDDLLDVARITQGKIALRKERVFIADIVRRVADGVPMMEDDRGQKLNVSMPDEKIVLEADPARLEQVLVNLLSNARKYSPPGSSIHLRCHFNDGEVVLRVRDEGMGIAPDMLPRVFELFAQADRSLDRVQGGLGIGLTIVKRLVELHGGRVEARSEGLGKGAEFTVRLPALPASEVGMAKSDDPRLAARLHAHVLIVEDNRDSAESLKMLLELLGHQVSVVHDGLAALESAGRAIPDVMLVDIGLPGIDGYEVARRARKDPRLRDVALVALTGYGSAEDKRAAVDAGFDHHLVKPIDPDALEGLVSRLKRPKPTTKSSPTVH
jgi:CheY-like chemotaxis protein